MQEMNVFLYVVWGEGSETEASRSIRSLYNVSPAANVMLISDKSFADQHVKSEWLGEPEKLSSQRHVIKVSSLCVAMDALAGYRVVYLDADTYMLASVNDLFAVLGTHDIALAHAPKRRTGRRLETRAAAMPDFNSGVMAFRPARVKSLFCEWERLVKTSSYNNDQTPLAEMLYLDTRFDIRLCVLPTEYNARTGWPFYVEDVVRILHGRGKSMEYATRAFTDNNIGGSRVWVPNRGKIIRHQ